MPPDPSALHDGLAPLRAKYLAHLRDSRQEIADFHAACEKAALTPEEREAMRQRAHKLSGTGKTFGFAAISETARALENALDKGARGATDALAALAQSLLSACDDALAASAGISLELVEEEDTNPSALIGIGQKPLLLAADDDPNIREMIQRLFAREADIITASDGKEALKLIEERHPDVVILDGMMPEMTGFKVLETLRGKPELAAIPVIMLTASNREKDVMRGLMDGAADYITKPFDPILLKKKIMERLHKRKITVLVADDDTIVRELLAHKFQAAGLRVLMAEDGEQALELARKHRPQLAVLDRMMPGLDGLAVLQKLREHSNTRDIPVLFLTAKRQEQNVLEAFRLGAADYIAKPFSPDEVMARCLRLLKSPKDGAP